MINQQSTSLETDGAILFRVLLVCVFGFEALASAQVQQAWVARYDGPAHLRDVPLALTLDAEGNVYVIGESVAANGSPDYATVKYDTNGHQVWAARYNGPGNDWDYPSAIAIDGVGNVYVSGESSAPGSSFDYATIKYDRDGRPLWVRRYKGPANRSDVGGPLALDSMGNVYVTGYSEDTNGIADIATVKYDPTGNQLWVARYNGPGWDSANSLVVDSSGNVYVNGFSGDGVRFDYVTLKYASDGRQLWVARYNGPANRNDQAGAITLDAGGNIYVTGWSEGVGTGFDCVTVKYDSNGNRLWATRYNGPGNTNDFGNDIAVDLAGSVYVTGISGSDDAHRGDFVTLKYDPNGNQLWVAHYDGPAEDYDEAAELAVDKIGNVYIAGMSFDVDYHRHYTTLKYGPTGKQLWVARYDGPQRNDAATALALDSSGNVFVTGFSYSDSGSDFATIKYVQTETAARLEGPRLWPNGMFSFTLVGEAGRSYTIQASTNLVNWTALTNFVSATGTNQFTDTIASNLSREFYRAVTP